MHRIIQVDDDGSLRIPAELLRGSQPNGGYEVEVRDHTILLHPTDKPAPFWAVAAPDERAARMRAWADEKRPTAAALPAEALRREQIYD